MYSATGNPSVCYQALLKALIYKNMKSVSYLSDLVRELEDHPDLALTFGFHPYQLPHPNNFLAFLEESCPPRIPEFNYSGGL
ncbi:MAG: transposase [Candidatus Atribacteria bacterium]|nr:transposase [Candidatus Atribacteria bacterium]